MRLEQLPGSAYTNANNYELYYDGAVVRVSSSQSANADDPIAISDNIPCDARFFSIRFFGWSSDETKEFDPPTVAHVSVVTKAYELSQVLKVITQLTYVQDVVAVAHRSLLLGNSYPACWHNSTQKFTYLGDSPYTRPRISTAKLVP